MPLAIDQRKQIRNELKCGNLPKDVVFYIEMYKNLSNRADWRKTLLFEVLGEVALHWYETNYGEIKMNTQLNGSKTQQFGVTHVKGFRLTLNNKDRHRNEWHDDLDDPIEAYGATYEELIKNIAPLYKAKIEANEKLSNKFYSFVGDEYDIYSINYFIFDGNLYIDPKSEPDEEVEFNKTAEEILVDIKKELEKSK